MRPAGRTYLKDKIGALLAKGVLLIIESEKRSDSVDGNEKAV